MNIAILLVGSLLILSNSNAQVANEDRLVNPNKDTHQKRVEKAFAEAKKIQDDILEMMAKEKPKYKLINKRANHMKWGPDGPNGITSNEMTWQNGKQQELFVVISLRLSREGLSEYFWKQLNFISMGDFFKVSEIGDEAILVKNVHANTTLTDVGLHFIKGRAMVNTYYRNRKQSTEKNEKELRELVGLIEPLIVARDNFDDD